MWLLLAAAVAAPVPNPVSVYSDCVVAINQYANCPFLIGDVWYSVYCCKERLDIVNPELERCLGPASLDECNFLVTTTFNSWCCNAPDAPDPSAYDDDGMFFLDSGQVSLADDDGYDFENS